jgi:hypothetical protein
VLLSPVHLRTLRSIQYLDPRPLEDLRAQIFGKFKSWEYQIEIGNSVSLDLTKHNCGGFAKF